MPQYTNKHYALPMLLDPWFKIQKFSLSSAVIQARQCLTEKLLTGVQNNDPPATKRHHKHIDRSSQEQSSLWLSFDSMIQTGDETDALLAESLSTAELKLFERAKLTKAFKSYHVLAREENILPCFSKIGCKVLKYTCSFCCIREVV